MCFMYFRFRSMRISFISKESTKLRQLRTIHVYDLPLWLFLQFQPGNRTARLPGSYEEALSERGTTRSPAKSMHHFFYIKE